MSEHNRSQNTDERTIALDGVSKKFCRSLRRSMRLGLGHLAQAFLAKPPDTTTLHAEEFWAIDDLSLEARKGEIIGITGDNGSGKSTLLRLIGGILPPDKGEIRTRGRIAALLEAGAGFHPHMTGRENLFVNGAIMGFCKRTLQEKQAEIEAFSELGEMLDAPLAAFSPGMRVRLGVAIALSVKPSILLFDEVLNVTDWAFREKCFQRLHEMQAETTILFVSHDPRQIENHCTSVLTLERGRLPKNDKME